MRFSEKFDKNKIIFSIRSKILKIINSPDLYIWWWNCS